MSFPDTPSSETSKKAGLLGGVMRAVSKRFVLVALFTMLITAGAFPSPSAFARDKQAGEPTVGRQAPKAEKGQKGIRQIIRRMLPKSVLLLPKG